MNRLEIQRMIWQSKYDRIKLRRVLDRIERGDKMDKVFEIIVKLAKSFEVQVGYEDGWIVLKLRPRIGDKDAE